MSELQEIGATNAPATMNATAQSLAAIDFKAIVNNATPEQLGAMARVYMAQQKMAAFTDIVKLAKIDYEAEKNLFIENAGRTRSVNTSRTYRNAIEGAHGLEAFCATRNISVLELTPAQADDFIYWRCHSAKPETVRSAVTASSSFFTWLERRYKGVISNPFRGTKARPAIERTRPNLPTADEVKAIIAALPPKWAAAVSLLAYRGLRVGALAALSIKGNRFATRSKGKDISGALPDEVIEVVKNAGLKLRQPFDGMNAAQLQHAITYQLSKLYEAGKVRAMFSPHKFRHFYAIQEHAKDHDIKRISDLLGHRSIAITETYLRGLDLID